MGRRQGTAGVGVVHADPGRVDHVAAAVEILLIKHFNNWQISINNFIYFKTAKLLHPGQRKLRIISQKE